jgi:hypothetical protein
MGEAWVWAGLGDIMLQFRPVSILPQAAYFVGIYLLLPIEHLNATMSILHHATTLQAAVNIDAEQCFRPGHSGFAGPGIYFSETEDSALRHCFNGRGGAEVVILCEVDLGELMVAEKYEADEETCMLSGFDSVLVEFTDTYCVWDSSRIDIRMFQDVDTGEWYASMDELLLNSW